jgi:DNA-binding CsgD family transcriptional regulator
MQRSNVGDGELLDLVGDIYDCALQPSRWPAALERLSVAIRGTNCAVCLHAIPAEPQLSLVANWNVDPAFEEAMARNYPQNPFVPLVWFKAVDEPCSALTEIAEDQLKATSWYSATMGRYGLRDSAFTILAKSTRQFGTLSIQRAKDQEPFDGDDLAMLARIAPHVRRAVMIGDLLQARSLELNALSATLDALAIAVVITTKDARITFANRKAEQHLSSATALRLEGGRLSAVDPRSSEALQAAIDTAAAGTKVDIPGGSIVVSVERRNERPLAAWVLPLDAGLREQLGATFAGQVAIFIREFGDATPVPAEVFVRQYGVTPAECRVLLLLVQGMTPDAVADALGISATTVKSHIGKLLVKTNVQRQVDLVRLAMSVLAPVA